MVYHLQVISASQKQELILIDQHYPWKDAQVHISQDSISDHLYFKFLWIVIYFKTKNLIFQHFKALPLESFRFSFWLILIKSNTSKENDEVQVHLTLFTILFIFFNLEFSLCNLCNFFTSKVAAIKVAVCDFQDYFSKSQTCATFSMW